MTVNAVATTVTPGHAEIPVDDAVIVATFPHDPAAFTEGLFYRDGFLYESTGQKGQSSIRKVDLTSGRIIEQQEINSEYFGEGIVAWNQRLIELTWQDHIGFVRDLATFKEVARFRIDGEGWALTEDGAHLIMSDGTADLQFLNPETFAVTGRVNVTCDGQSVKNINELEWVRDEIYANIWLTDLIVRINPKSGAVTGVIDLATLAASNPPDPADKVPNGIAFDPAGDRLFVTGKLWPSLYQIRLVPRAGAPGICARLH